MHLQSSITVLNLYKNDNNNRTARFGKPSLWPSFYILKNQKEKTFDQRFAGSIFRRNRAFLDDVGRTGDTGRDAAAAGIPFLSVSRGRIRNPVTREQINKDSKTYRLNPSI